MNKSFNPRAGFTLVEAVCAMAVIAVCALTLWMGLRSALAVTRRSADLARESDRAFALCQTEIGGSAGQISFKANGIIYTVDGLFTSGQAGAVQYAAFNPLQAGLP